MQHRFRTAVAAVTATFALIGVATVVEADDEPDITTTTTEAPPPSVTVQVIAEAEPDQPPPGYITETPEPEPTVSSTTTEVPDETPEVVADNPAPPDTAEVTTTTLFQGHAADEETVVTGTQVAVAASGGNQTHNDGTPTGSTVALGGQVDTGAADAVGSRDENVIAQQADVILTEQAVANILQVALILNIGAALANSGANGINSTPGGSSNPGAIGSGDASATGMEIDQYVTQAARTEATQEMDDLASQLAISLWLGLAFADSGTNSITGTGIAGSGGQVGSGDATAVGNDSLTDIEQRAAIVGSGTSVTDVTQRATVLNLGFALANSGLNSISGVAAGLLTAGDGQDVLAQQMFAMLLPALLSSYGYGPAGSGTVTSGDASAVGNDSETYVAQIAAAASSGDGINRIVQEVLVANMGVAGANTGVNSLGQGIATLDAPTAEAVVKMAAFLASLLAVVHGATGSTMAGMAETGIEIPFGDLILQVGGMLDVFDRSGSTPTGARANIRQISIVLSLGVARANSGLNQVQTVNTTPAAIPLESQTAATRTAEVNTELAAVGAAETDAAVDTIATGRADAGNRGNLVIICQRINAVDIECLAPPPPPPDPVEEPPAVTTTTVVPAVAEPVPTTTAPAVIAGVAAASSMSGATPQAFRVAPPATTGSHLPATGFDVRHIVAWALVMLVAGMVAVLGARRRPVRR
jgi:hypothetical protein